MITFLSDFGLTDTYVGVCRAVIATIAPDATVIDLTHTVPALDLHRGASALADCVTVAPPAVHLAVVDPDAMARPGIVIVAGASCLVGPDNGLLLPAADALGGADAAYVLTDGRWHRTPVSPVFRARDVFAPVAAHVAAGVAPSGVGPPCDPARLQRLERAETAVEHRRIATRIRHVDCYGNVQLSVTAGDLRRAGLDHGRPVPVNTDRETLLVRRVDSFSDLASGELGIVEDSFGWLAIVAGAAAAAEQLDLSPADSVRLGDD